VGEAGGVRMGRNWQNTNCALAASDPDSCKKEEQGLKKTSHGDRILAVWTNARGWAEFLYSAEPGQKLIGRSAALARECSREREGRVPGRLG